MPPASLSTLEVINPGPTTASSSVKRRRSPRIFFCKSVSPVLTRSNFAVMASQFIALLEFPFLVFQQLCHHVFHGDRANRPVFFINYRPHPQIVLVEKF